MEISQMQMDPIAIVIVAAVALVILKLFVFKPKMPPAKGFTCARCKTYETYTARTIDAWRRGFKKLYCRSCHQAWLARNPNRQYSHTSQAKGCASVLVVGVFVPIALVVAGSIVL
jgi:hypothetical protein